MEKGLVLDYTELMKGGLSMIHIGSSMLRRIKIVFIHCTHFACIVYRFVDTLFIAMALIAIGIVLTPLLISFYKAIDH